MYQIKIYTTVGTFLSVPLDGDRYRKLTNEISAARAAAHTNFPEASLVFLSTEGLTTISPAAMATSAYTIINLDVTQTHPHFERKHIPSRPGAAPDIVSGNDYGNAYVGLGDK